MTKKYQSIIGKFAPVISLLVLGGVWLFVSEGGIVVAVRAEDLAQGEAAGETAEKKNFFTLIADSLEKLLPPALSVLTSRRLLISFLPKKPIRLAARISPLRFLQTM